MTRFEDGRDLETTRIVDGFGLTIFEASPDRGDQTYWYDAASRLTRKTDADGVETIYAYDDAGRLLSETFTGSPADTVTYTYDSTAGGNRGVGRLTGVTDPSGGTALTYDAQGRLTLSDQTIGGQSYALAYAHDRDGGVVSITYPSGRIVEIERDPEGRITDIGTRASAMASLVSVVADAAYAPFGPLTGLTHANGLVLNQDHDLNYWQTGLELAAPGAHRLDLAFDRDDAGALDGVTDNLATGRGASFGYTDAGRLQYAVGAWGDHSFGYDPAGNRTELRTDTGGVVAYEFAITAPESNRIEEVRDTGWNVIRDLTWRDGGDLYQQQFTGGDAQTLFYDARKRLVELQVNAVGVASYGYDHDGRRVSATVGGQTTHYVFDADGRLLAEHAGGTGAVLREYVWLGRPPGRPARHSGRRDDDLRHPHRPDRRAPADDRRGEGRRVERGGHALGRGGHTIAGDDGPRPAPPGPVASGRKRAASELDAGLRPDPGTVYPSRPFGTGRGPEPVRLCGWRPAECGGSDGGNSALAHRSRNRHRP
jgi:YD repeat-containing protein